MDYGKYHNLEKYLLDEVSDKYHTNKYLSAEDFFCIIIWKANRSKSKIAKKLLSYEYEHLDDAVRALTEGLYHQTTNKARMRYLISSWDFRLPMASAILCMLYPEEFTVYDIRVCNALGNFHNIGNTKKFNKLWGNYLEYLQAVKNETPSCMALREKDHYLWGKSFYTQLKKDIQNSFKIEI